MVSVPSTAAPGGPVHIGISLGGIGSLYDGLGEFATQIGSHVATCAVDWRERLGIRFTFHCRERLFGSFGGDVDYLPVTRWQRMRHVQPCRYAIWHSLHQLNKTQAPQGAEVRLLTVHDLNYLYGRNAFSTWRHHRRTRALARRTDHIVAISEHTAADVRQHLHWTGPLEVIHRGPRDFLSVQPEPVPEFAGFAGFAGFDAAPRPFLFHLSRMSPSKNPDALLALAASWPEMDFLFCGPPTDEAQALMAANRLPNAHFSLGISAAQKAWAFRHCAGFLFPSLTEGFGLPPVEALQFGKPVFLSRLTSLPEVGGDAAFYFDDWAPSAMRQVVEAGLRRAAEPGHADAMRAQAARFDWVALADAYLALYLRLLGRPGTALRAG